MSTLDKDGFHKLLKYFSSVYLETEKATTSGTGVTFSSIPAGVKRITIMFDNVSTDGTDHILVQLGDAGGIETSGYLAASMNSASTAVGTTSSTAGFICRVGGTARLLCGSMIVSRMDTSHKWVYQLSASLTSLTGALMGGGVKTLSAELTQLKLLPTGSDDFDNGAVNIMYEV